ncbi:unnamed protein product [Clonostachys chloroleuca]|uniref:Carotenoid oxygenase n=1 Tax=Clonostachys chloroleuca TaxID=1926264 RepID=A0AA35Q5J8_9HYPO|nr:unnamed protein product [Clonostachys chloroleuca]
MMVALRRLLPFVLSFSRLTRAEDDLPAWFEPPPGSDPITWGFYGTHEMREPTQLKVEGYFPHWLTGSLYRGGAGIWDVGNYTAEHWFDGFSRNHRFEIANGMVSYRSRNGSDEIMDFVRETGRYPEKSFGSDPCKMIFGAFETTFRDGISPHGNKSCMNIAVSYVSNFPGIIGNSTDGNVPFKIFVSTTDANGLQQIDPDTLEPTEIFTYQASHALLVNGSQSAAHPVHTADGSLYKYVLDLSSSPPIYRVFGIHPASGETQLLANITDTPPAYIHSLFGTEKHIVLIIWQADFTQEANNIVDSIGPWDPERRALFYVINRANGGIVGKYEAPDAFFAFHQIKSFEDKAGNIFVDLPRMNDTSFLSAARIPNLRANLGTPNATSKNDLAGSFTRYRLPRLCKFPQSGNGTLETTPARIEFSLPYGEANIELPRINPARDGKPYRFSYGIHVQKAGNFADSIIEIDTEKRRWKVWAPETKHLPSEPIFVSKPNPTSEDDGVLLTVTIDSKSKRSSSLVVIDAKNMKELGRARMPIVMGYGFHGVWGQAS